VAAAAAGVCPGGGGGPRLSRSRLNSRPLPSSFLCPPPASLLLAPKLVVGASTSPRRRPPGPDPAAASPDPGPLGPDLAVAGLCPPPTSCRRAPVPRRRGLLRCVGWPRRRRCRPGPLSLRWLGAVATAARLGWPRRARLRPPTPSFTPWCWWPGPLGLGPPSLAAAGGRFGPGGAACGRGLGVRVSAPLPSPWPLVGGPLPVVAVGWWGASAGWGAVRWRCRRLMFLAGGLRLAPKSFERKLCSVLCWANNDGACGRRSPPWRRCCVVLGVVVLPPRFHPLGAACAGSSSRGGVG